jgi:hypothetical protein
MSSTTASAGPGRSFVDGSTVHPSRPESGGCARIISGSGPRFSGTGGDRPVDQRVAQSIVDVARELETGRHPPNGVIDVVVRSGFGRVESAAEPPCQSMSLPQEAEADARRPLRVDQHFHQPQIPSASSEIGGSAVDERVLRTAAFSKIVTMSGDQRQAARAAAHRGEASSHLVPPKGLSFVGGGDRARRARRNSARAAPDRPRPSFTARRIRWA